MNNQTYTIEVETIMWRNWNVIYSKKHDNITIYRTSECGTYLEFSFGQKIERFFNDQTYFYNDIISLGEL